MTDKWIENVRPFPEPPPDVATLLERYEGSRTKRFACVVVAFDAAIASMMDTPDEDFGHYINRELVPFILEERKRAATEEGLSTVLEWENSLLPQA